VLRSGRLALVLAIAVSLIGCAAPSAEAPRQAAAPPAQVSGQPRTLIMVVNTEVTNLARKIIGPTNPERTTRVFNADLAIIDGRGEPRPYLAAELPKLNTDTWRVSPDGRMETTWKLRPGLTWHDGATLTANDFAFAFKLYNSPGLSVFVPKPQDRVEDVVAVDPQTVLIRWRSPFLFTGEGLDPLPAHLLGQPFAAYEQDPAGGRDAFLAQRFWTTDYVGAGPYRLTNWEPASHLEGTAFVGHALGKPKIDRVVIRLMNDENTVLTNLLSGSVHLTMAQAIRFEHAMVLRREWGLDKGEGAGKVLFLATSTTTAVPQHRPEYQKAPALLDVRVRRALFHALDRDAINDGIFEGQSPAPNTFLGREVPYYAQVDAAIAKYPYDPRRAEQLMNEAGLRKDREGLFATANGERLQPTFWISAGAQREQMMAIATHGWKQAGVDMQPYVMPRALERDQEARATFPHILVHGISLGEDGALENTTREQIPRPDNRWGGQNRGGWWSPEYERLWDAYNTTLDRQEQIRAIVQMMKIRSEEVVAFPLHYSVNVTAHLANLRGPDVGISETTSHWNIHEWELN
jgi:peptide/nickel transport system substrate-binding protein